MQVRVEVVTMSVYSMSGWNVTGILLRWIARLIICAKVPLQNVKDFYTRANRRFEGDVVKMTLHPHVWPQWKWSDPALDVTKTDTTAFTLRDFSKCLHKLSFRIINSVSSGQVKCVWSQCNWFGLWQMSPKRITWCLRSLTSQAKGLCFSEACEMEGLSRWG